MESIRFEIPQMRSFIKAIEETPKAELRAMRSSMKKGLKRVKTKFITTQLHGPPGINATGRLSTGKNVFSRVDGNSLQSVVAMIGISRILHVHEIGLTITGKGIVGGKLFLHEKGRGPVFAVVTKVVIPARLKFRALVAAETPPFFAQVGKDVVQATATTLQKGLLRA